MRKFFRSHTMVFLSMGLGLVTGLFRVPVLMGLASGLSEIFLHYLSMIAAPIVLLAIVSTLISVRLDAIKTLGRRVISYTLLTTTLASLIALGCFLVLDPVSSASQALEKGAVVSHSYWDFLIDIVPSNIVKAFLENKVISIAFLGFLFGISAHFLPEEHRTTLQKGASALFQLFLKLAGWVVYAMPIASWAFTALLVQEMGANRTEVSGLFVYLCGVILANLIQGVVLIPILLKMNGISPLRLAKKSFPALLLAFFTKSSNATLPLSLQVAKEKLKIRPYVAEFSLPLCTVINMNGCAAFILSTVLFVAGVNGHVFTAFDLVFWVFLSVLAAVGNAGVPMGCFFLSSACLMSMDVPLAMMGLILPFYTLIDMEETALNVWSDLSVTALIDGEVSEVYTHSTPKWPNKTDF